MSGNLAELRDRVKVLTGLLLKTRPYSLWEPWWEATAFLNDTQAEDVLMALAGSLDAAERFRNAVLPGSRIEVVQGGPDLFKAVIASGEAAVSYHLSEPIARVLAVLEALISQAEAKRRTKAHSTPFKRTSICSSATKYGRR